MKGETGSPRIAILLACYNGERHLDEQMRSIFAQTHDDFIVIARDDGSDDNTPTILRRWANEHSGRMIVISDNRGNLRSLANFSLLMESCAAPYFAFCDQDDVWMPDKLQICLDEIQRLEASHGTSTPILVHSDLKVVDHTTQEVWPSYFAHRHIDAESGTELANMLFSNVVTGCTLMGNRALLELGRPIPKEFPYHDWWLGLVAASCGIVKTIPRSTVLYRQHESNQVGAGPAKRRSTVWETRYVLLQPKLLRFRMRRVQFYAFLLVNAVGKGMPPHNRQFLRALCRPLLRDEVARLSWLRRTGLLVRSLAIQLRLLPLVVRWYY